MDREQIEALKTLAEHATIIYLSTLEKSGSVKTAETITKIFVQSLLKPDETPKFFIQGGAE